MRVDQVVSTSRVLRHMYVLSFVFLVCLTYLAYVPCNAEENNVRFPQSVISDVLYTQRLSHIAFHNNALRGVLVDLVSNNSQHQTVIVVVGVEWGTEVEYFANKGYAVYAFEPLSRFVKHLQATLKQNPQWNVTVLPVAAGSTRDAFVQVTYPNANITEYVKAATVDDYVHDEVTVLSIDIQGNELDVLKGCTALIKREKPLVRSLVR